MKMKWCVAGFLMLVLCSGVPLHAGESFESTKALAESGKAEAQFNLGNKYYEGEGVKKDFIEALKWYRKAAEQGYADAQNSLGNMYYEGEGVEKNFVESVKWFRKAAEQGDATSQFCLGACYGLGQGVTQNDIQAYIWSSLAAAQGAKNGAITRDIYAERMSREEIIEGQRRAGAFVPHKQTARSSSNNSTSPEIPTVIGTGFFITDDGYLISNYHVVKDAAKVRVVTSAGTLDAKVVQVDAANDLALLKVDGRFAPLPVAASRKVQLGSTVATVGFPDPGLQGFSPKLAKGEIAALAGAGDDARYFQISVPVQPGNSGGALVDERGNVVGIVSAKLSARAALASSGSLPENVNYAVKSSFLLSFLESVPDVANRLKEPNTKDEKFEDVVKDAQNATVLILVY
jgi:S1-C subfamily serine protease